MRSDLGDSATHPMFEKSKRDGRKNGIFFFLIFVFFFVVVDGFVLFLFFFLVLFLFFICFCFLFVFVLFVTKTVGIKFFFYPVFFFLPSFFTIILKPFPQTNGFYIQLARRLTLFRFFLTTTGKSSIYMVLHTKLPFP